MIELEADSGSLNNVGFEGVKRGQPYLQYEKTDISIRY